MTPSARLAPAEQHLPSRPEMVTILERAVDRYVAARHAGVAAFVDNNFSLAASLKLHRRALGRDLIRAPANVALAVPFLAKMLAAAVLRSAGARRASERLRRKQIFLETDVAGELVWRLYTDLLQLPYEDKRTGRRSDRDALADEILADPEIAAAIGIVNSSRGAAVARDAWAERIGAQVQAYAQARSAAGEIVNNAVFAGAGAVLFKNLTPGALSLGPLVAASVAQQSAIAGFPLGAGLGSLWYSVFAATPSAALVGGVTTGAMAVGAVMTAFAGVISDPVQRAAGLHQRRLHRFLDVLSAELKGGTKTFAVRDHYLARIFDLIDLARATLQVASR